MMVIEAALPAGSVMVTHNRVYWNELHESNKYSAHGHQALQQQQLVAVDKVWKSSNVLNTVQTAWMLPLCNAIRHVPAEHWIHCTAA